MELTFADWPLLPVYLHQRCRPHGMIAQQIARNPPPSGTAQAIARLVKYKQLTGDRFPAHCQTRMVVISANKNGCDEDFPVG